MIAGATGSGTGGLGIAMQVLADHYLSMGLNPEIIHRVASIASIWIRQLASQWSGRNSYSCLWLQS